MSSGHILVLDTGSSGPRCFVFDREGRTVGGSGSRWEYAPAEEESDLAREFDPGWLWRTLCDLVGTALSDARVPAASIDAVSVTGQRQAVAFVDAACDTLYVGPNIDLRAVFEGAALDEELGDRIYRTTGHTPSLLFAPAKLRWFKAHRPEAHGRIASVLTLPDWVVWRLTGRAASEPTLAGEAGLLDVTRREWCGPLLRDMGLSINTSTPLLQAGDVAGDVTPEASLRTGLPAGTPVAVAGADTQCGLLGAGVFETGQAGVIAGWSVPVQMVTNQPMFSPQSRTWTGCSLVPDSWVAESTAGDAGNTYRWLAETLYGGAEGAFDDMDAAARAVPVGAEGTTAVLGPGAMNAADLGMKMGGILFPTPLTFSNIGRGHLVRATFEAMAYAIRANIEQAESVAGQAPSAIAVGGGMIRSRTFTGLLADVLGREVRFSSVPHTSALGAYLCAAVALEQYGSIEEAAAAAAGWATCSEPGPLASAEYGGLYEDWGRLSSRVRELELS